jgi:hypothetical protein
MMMMTIMAIGRDYVSELRPQPVLLFITQVIYEHGQPWWNDFDWGTTSQPKYHNQQYSKMLCTLIVSILPSLRLRLVEETPVYFVF